MFFALIPARMGSQRLARKNLRELGGIPLIVRAIQKCRDCGEFDEIWVNSEHPKLKNLKIEGFFINPKLVRYSLN
jgi:CMP-N-acetylneuraminic acid synthetase